MVASCRLAAQVVRPALERGRTLNGHRASILLASVICFSAIACSGTSDDIERGRGGASGAAGVSGSAGLAGTGGSGQPDASDEDVSIPPDGSGGTPSTEGGPPDGSEVGTDAACTPFHVTPTPVTGSIYIMADRSGSMSTGDLWTQQASALGDFFSDAANGGLEVALKFFPLGDVCDPEDALCSGKAYAQPLVPWGLLSAMAPEFTTAVMEATPDGCITPTQEALGGALLGARARRQEMPFLETAAVLVSDGEPCCGTCPCEQEVCIAEVAAPSAQDAKPIKTYAVFLADVAQPAMNAIAVAGGTGAAYSGVSGAVAIRAALTDIAERVVACRFQMPTDQGQVVALGDVALFLNDGGGQPPVLVERRNDAASCGVTGGWYADDPAEPRKVILCEATCNHFQATSGATLDYVVQCGTVADAGVDSGTCGGPSDVCPGTAIVLTGSGDSPRIGTAQGDTTGLCDDGAATCGASAGTPDAVYTFTSDVNGHATVTLGGAAVASWDAVLHARSACGTPSSELACGDVFSPVSVGSETLVFSVAANTPYYVFVDGFMGQTGAFTLDIAVEPEGCGNGYTEPSEECDDGNAINDDWCRNDCTINPNPAGDTCPGVTMQLTGTGTDPRTGSVVGSTAGMSASMTSLGCAASATGAASDIVVNVTPDVDGTMVCNLGGAVLTPFDAVLYVRTGCDDAMSEIACDDAVSDGEDVVEFAAAAGTKYYVIVDGYGATHSGPFTLTCVLTQPGCGNGIKEAFEQCDDGNTLPNDGCDANCQIEPQGPADVCPGDALVLTESGGSWLAAVSGDTSVLSSAYAGNCGQSGSSPEAVFHFTAPITGTAVATLPTTGTSFDSVLYVRSGACEGSLATELDCNDAYTNGGEVITFGAQANSEYWIFVDGYASQSGGFALELSLSAN